MFFSVNNETYCVALLFCHWDLRHTLRLFSIFAFSINYLLKTLLNIVSVVLILLNEWSGTKNIYLFDPLYIFSSLVTSFRALTSPFPSTLIIKGNTNNGENPSSCFFSFSSYRIYQRRIKISYQWRNPKLQVKPKQLQVLS